MTILSVRLSDEEYNALSSYAKTSGKSMNKALKDTFFEMLEEQYDIELFDKAYAEYLKNKKTYTTDQLLEELKIEL